MQMVLNGIGGQGVLFLSKILTKAALRKFGKVVASETIGMAQRGGSVVSFLKLGKKYKSPMIISGTADIVICLQEQELKNSKGFLREGGKLYLNSDEYFNATEIALKEKAPSMANVIFLGYLAKDNDFPLGKDEIHPVLPEKACPFFELGYNAV